MADRDGEIAHARETLVRALREHALVLGEVTLTSGARAQYYVDAKRAILRPEGFAAVSLLLAEQVRAWRGTAVGGMTMGADPLACAALAGVMLRRSPATTARAAAARGRGRRSRRRRA